MTEYTKKVSDLAFYGKSKLYINAHTLLNNSDFSSYINKKMDLLCIEDDNDDIPMKYFLSLVLDCNVKNIILKINSINRYKELIMCLKNMPNIDKEFYINFDNNEYSMNDICEIATPYAIIINPAINEKTITRVDYDKRENLDFIATDFYSLLDPDIISHKDFLDYIDVLVDYINKNASNDYEKVVLLSEIIRKSFKYDARLITGNKKLSKRYISSHYAESLIKYGVGVCNCISSFVEIVLNHPSINIKTNSISSDNHAWNEMFIDGKWYCSDFTRNMLSITPHYGQLKLYNYVNKSFTCFVDKVDSPRFKKIIDSYLEKIKPQSEILVTKPTIPKYRYAGYDFGSRKEKLGFEKYSELDPLILYKCYDAIHGLELNFEDIIDMYINDDNYNSGFNM